MFDPRASALVIVHVAVTKLPPQFEETSEHLVLPSFEFMLNVAEVDETRTRASMCEAAEAGHKNDFAYS